MTGTVSWLLGENPLSTTFVVRKGRGKDTKATND